MQKMIDAGIISASEAGMIRRIVIDIKPGHIPIMYIERLIDPEVIDVLMTLDGIQIVGAKDVPRPRSCPDCHSPGFNVPGCQNLWHVEVRG